MKAALLLFFAGLGFPLGAALARFILWMDAQKRPPRRRQATALPGGIAIIGIGLNLGFVVLNAAARNWHQMQDHLFIAVFFVLVTFGAWFATKRAQSRPSDRPNYGDDI